MNELTKHSGNGLNTIQIGFGEGGDGITTTTFITYNIYENDTEAAAKGKEAHPAPDGQFESEADTSRKSLIL